MWRRVCARWGKTCVRMCTQGSVCMPLSTTAPGNCSREGRAQAGEAEGRNKPAYLQVQEKGAWLQERRRPKEETVNKQVCPPLSSISSGKGWMTGRWT